MQNHLEISSKNKFWIQNMQNWTKSRKSDMSGRSAGGRRRSGFLAEIRLRTPLKSSQKPSSRSISCKFRTICTLPGRVRTSKCTESWNCSCGKKDIPAMFSHCSACGKSKTTENVSQSMEDKDDEDLTEGEKVWKRKNPLWEVKWGGRSSHPKVHVPWQSVVHMIQRTSRIAGGSTGPSTGGP